MATIRDRYVLDIDTKGATKGINGVKAALGGLFGAIAINELQQLGQSIVRTGLEFEKFETILQTLTGSQRQAQQELQRLQDLSKELPQDVGDLTRSFIILKRNGIDTSKDSLQALSNVATANGKSLEQVGEAVADALTGEFERLKEFGIRVSQEGEQISVSLGNSFLGSVNSGRELVDLLVDLGNTQYGDAAENNADTLGQSLSNLRGAAAVASSEFTQGLRPALKEVTDEITALLEKNDDLARELGADLGDGIRAASAAAKFFANNLETLRVVAIALVSLRATAFFLELGSTISAGIRNIISYSKNVRNLAAQLKGLENGTKSVGMLRTAFSVLLRFINPVTAIISGIVTVLYAFRNASIELGDTTTTLGEILQATFSASLEVIRDLFNYIQENAAAAFSYLTEALAPLATRVSSVFGTLITISKTWTNTVIGLFRGFFQFVSEGFVAMPTLVPQILSSIGDAFLVFIEQSKRSFGELFDYITSFGNDPIELELDKFLSDFSSSFDQINAVPSVDWDNLLSTDYLGAAGDIIEGTLEQLVINYREKTAALRNDTDALNDNNDAQDDNNSKTAEQNALLRTQQAIRESQARTEEIIADIKQRQADAIVDQQLEGLRGITRELKEIEVREMRAARASKQRLRDQLAAGQDPSIIQGQLQAIDAATKASIKAQQEAVIAANEEARKFSTGWKNAFEEYQDEATNAAKTAERLFQTTTKSMEDSIVNFVKTGKLSFSDLIDTILEELLRSQIQQLIGSTFGFLGGGSGGGGIGGAIDTFAGFFANGGTIPSGQFGVVGENGPELVSGPAQVTPNVGGTSVTYNINAVDAQSFKQMVARDPEFMYAVTERGRRSLPQGRR